jgi:hypothetical protein
MTDELKNIMLENIRLSFHHRIHRFYGNTLKDAIFNVNEISEDVKPVGEKEMWVDINFTMNDEDLSIRQGLFLLEARMGETIIKDIKDIKTLKIMKKIEATRDYPGQMFAGRYEYCNVYPADKPLKGHVEQLYFPYPFDTYVSVRNCKTWGDLFEKIYKRFRQLYWKDRREKGEDTVAWHYLGDYVVEDVDIYDDGVAMVYIGS